MSTLRRLVRFLPLAAPLVLLAGCERSPDIAHGVEDPTFLTPSATWEDSVEADAAAQRRDELEQALQRLRDETASGWVGRQDDVTGYLGELRGGSWSDDGADVAELGGAFLAAHAEALFGVAPAQLVVPRDVSPDAAGFAVLRVEQHIDDVPVVDAALAVTIAGADSQPRVSAALGRVFPGLDVATEPELTAKQASAAARRASGGTTQGRPELVVVADGAGILAWRVAVLGDTFGGPASASFYFIDAATGEVVSVQPGNSGSAVRVPRQWATGSVARAAMGATQGGAQGEAVPIAGADPNGDRVAGTGTRSGDGTIALVDTTTATYDPATDQGGIRTHDAGNSDDFSRLPGPIVTSATPEIGDPEAIAAHAFLRYVHDYYGTVHGRPGLDGLGGSTTVSVHFGGSDFCNAMFLWDTKHMVFGDDCLDPGGSRIATMVDVDIAGHELTHGVTLTSANLLYTGQSGALNESFSDYFGVTIGNHYRGVDDAEYAEGGCVGIEQPNYACVASSDPDGGTTQRYMLNGASLADYAYVLDMPIPLKIGLGLSQDNGGVHFNSGIWNNALWSIKARLAQIDGAPSMSSPRATAFDQVVYAALTRHLTPTSGFLEARTAIEQAATELAVDPVIIDVAREVFDLNGICAGCNPPPPSPAHVVASGASTEINALVAGDRVAWLEYASGEIAGDVTTASIGGAPARTGAFGVTLAYAGDLLVYSTDNLGVEAIGPDGTSQRLGSGIDFPSAIVGVAGSPQGAAWLELANGTMNFVAPDGTVTTAQPPEELRRGTPLAIATGDRTVAVATREGSLIVWQVGQQPRVLDQLPAPPLALAAHGQRVAVMFIGPGDQGSLAPSGPLRLYDLSGGHTEISGLAAPFGLALDDRYLVWAQETGKLGGAALADLAAGGLSFPDTSLYLYSLQRGITYALLDQRGQQGFPAISGDRLVWLDAVNEGNDVMTGVLPPGL